jgi:hypothetical protein
MKEFDRTGIKMDNGAAVETSLIAPPNGVPKAAVPSGKPTLRSRIASRMGRPELAVLGWEFRGQRLTARG